jgi:hypothetical protein
LFLLDVRENGAEALVLSNGSMRHALILVENGVGERDALPAELQTLTSLCLIIIVMLKIF